MRHVDLNVYKVKANLTKESSTRFKTFVCQISKFFLAYFPQGKDSTAKFFAFLFAKWCFMIQE